MSSYSGTFAEVIASLGGPGTDLSTFTTEDNLQKTLPAIAIPAGFFTGGGSKARSLKVKASGRISTFTSGTFTWSLRLLTSETWSAGGILLGATPAVTMVASQTLVPWFADIDVTLRAESILGATSAVTMGLVESAAIASPFYASIPAANVSPAVSTIDAQTPYYLFMSAACSVSNAANLVNIQAIKAYGEN